MQMREKLKLENKNGRRGALFSGLSVNKFWKIINGKRRQERKETFMHWNCRGRVLENNRERINGILAQHEPAVLAISEVNLRQDTDNQGGD